MKKHSPRSLKLQGKRFGRLTVLRPSDKRSSRHLCWICICACGKLTIVKGSALVSKNTKSCGCLRREILDKTTHGEKKTRLYRIWQGMKGRCYYPGAMSYAYYGRRGIIVCPEWKNSYSSFRDWALASGYQGNLTIDRINNDGNYEPSNCKWITGSENSKKRWVEQRKRIQRTLSKQKAIKWIIDTKAISPFTRNFVEWLYENNGAIVRVSQGERV